MKVFSDSMVAGADLSAKQYRAVKISANRTVIAAGDAESAYGILQNNPKSGEMAEVMVLGTSLLVLGGDVEAGDKIASDAHGEGVEVAAGEYYFAIAREGGVDGDIISVTLCSGQLNA